MSMSDTIIYHPISRIREFVRSYNKMSFHILTHQGRVTHTRVSKYTILVSDNGLSPGRRQAIIGINTDL